MRSTAFTFRATDEAWLQHWKTVPEPGWHDLFALTKRGAASREPVAVAAQGRPRNTYQLESPPDVLPYAT